MEGLTQWLTAAFTGIAAVAALFTVRDRLRGLEPVPPMLRHPGELSAEKILRAREVVRTPSGEYRALWSGILTVVNDSPYTRHIDRWAPAVGLEDDNAVVIKLKDAPRAVPPYGSLKLRYTFYMRSEAVRPGVFKGKLTLLYDGRRKLEIPYEFRMV